MQEMLTYREKLLTEIANMPEEHLKKLYSVFKIISTDFIQVKERDNNWKDDFRSISVWDDDNFDEIRKGFSRWKLKEF